MAAGKNNLIKLDYDSMEISAKNLVKEKDIFDDCIKNMGTIINGLPDIWSGETSEKYVDQFADLKPGFEEVRDLIEALAEQIRSIIKTVQDTDSGMAGQVGGK